MVFVIPWLVRNIFVIPSRPVESNEDSPSLGMKSYGGKICIGGNIPNRAMLAPRLIPLFREAVEQYEKALAPFDRYPRLRHEFIIANPAAIERTLLEKRKFHIVMPFNGEWIRAFMKMRMTPEVVVCKPNPLPVRLVWNKYDPNETLAAHQLFNQLIEEGRKAYRIKDDKWVPLNDFSPDDEECILSFPRKAQPPEVKVEAFPSIVELWKEFKQTMEELKKFDKWFK